MFAPMKCLRPWNVRAHEMFAPIKCSRPSNVRAHEMFAPIKCLRPCSDYLGSAESPTSVSFSVRLKGSLSDGVASPPWSSQTAWRALSQMVLSLLHAGLKWDLLSDLPSLYGRRVCRTVPACCTGTTCPNVRVLSNVCAREYFHLFLGIFADL